ncbi:MAG: hypothetical protein ACI3Z9_00820 [Candidatus Onthomorpha sp.]
MIKYYAYYNQGGYKDFYIGSQEENIKSKYFLPLLAVYECSLEENPNDEELRIQVEHQRNLPKLIALSDKTIDYNYPNSARVLMSHAGYKVLYKSIGCSLYALAIRDIIGPKDVYGRQTPFNMMFIGEEKDLRDMDIIAEYIRNNIFSFETEIGSIFVNDVKENGLRCDIGVLRDRLKDIIENETPLMVDENIRPSVRMLVISNRNMLNSAIKEQKLDGDDIYVCYKCDGSVLFSMINKNQNDFYDFKQDIYSTPSVHNMLNITKQEEVELLWKYVKELEKRIVELENINNHE